MIIIDSWLPQVFTDTWDNIEVYQIKKGMNFRVYRPDGTRILDGQQVDQWIASDDAYKWEEDMFIVNTERN